MKKNTFIPSADLVFTTVEQNRQRLLMAFRSLTVNTLTLDVTGVNQCDSAGLAFLIEAKRLARQYKKRCNIEGMHSSLLALAEFCGVQGVLGEGV